VKYDSYDRSEMLEFVPASASTLLDVGCASGRFGGALRARFPSMEIWGIDPSPPRHDRDQPYTTRLVGSFPDDIADGVAFDCVVFNDVLEHMVDPWEALERTHRILTERAKVVVSIPNVRHVQVLRPLILEGRWDYRDEGILDRTHLRFFTRATAMELLESTGFVVERVERLRWTGTGTSGRVATLNRALRGRLDDFLAQQFALVARSSRVASGG
jgi:SAM-dependent methyltransferase